MSNYEWLIARLDAFIRKYYANQVIRGTLIFLSCLLLYILMASVGEYFLYLPVWLRIIIDFLFVLLGSASLIIWVIIPLAKMNRLGKIISHEQAAWIIGRHFPEISDKLLNILQLKNLSDSSASRELIEASIDQKAKQISVVPITAAVDFSKNKRYLRYLLPVLLVGLFILVAAPNVFRDASKRLLEPTRTFIKPAPFLFVIKNKYLKAVQNADYTLHVTTTGNALPAEMYIELGSERVPMQATGQHNFEYTFRNVTAPVIFRLYAAGFYSTTYTLVVVQKPMLRNFKVQIDYPAYIGRKNEVRTSLGDMTLPVGTTVRWVFIADHTDKALMRLGNGATTEIPSSKNIFGTQYRFMNDTSYTFILSNHQSPVVDSYQYHVQVIPDQYPVIQVQQFKDTVSGKQIVLNGTVGDDYGITRVLFHYDISNADDHVMAQKNVPLKITPGALTTFQQYFDIETLNLQPGQKLSYYIEAWDNDGVHGSKASRSEVMTYQMYDAKQIDSAINESAQQINSSLNSSAQNTQQLQNQYQNVENKLLQSNDMDWEQQQSFQNMMQMQQQLQNQVESIKKRFEEQIQQSQQKQYSQDVRDKQQDLQKQMDNLMNNELKEEMKKLQELMKKLNKDQAFQTLQQVQQDNKLFNMDLQRMQELMKKLEMQMRMEDMANKMDSLAKKELSLKQQTDTHAKDNKALSQQQDAIKKQLDSAMKHDMGDMQKLNEQLQQKKSLSQSQQKGQQAQQNMQQSSQQLDQNSDSKASQSQSKAAQNLQQMADMMRSASSGMNMEQIEMDIREVRQILTNLIRLSFDQEDLMDKVRHTSVASQAYLTSSQEQNRLHENSYMIRDSLFVMSKKHFKLSAMVNKETTELEKNMKRAVSDLEDRNVSDAVTRQQYVMTHTNNLALMLNELLQNLIQMRNQQQQPGGMGSCNNPGGRKPKPGPGDQLSDIITQQQQLGDAMQQMQNAMQKKQGQGQNGSDGNEGDAEQLARLAEQQAALRRQIQELSSLLNSKGMGNSRQLQQAQQQMDKNETDLVNRHLTSELIKRQKEIMTRLLESEKAIREQEQDDKRTSRSGKEMPRPVPPELQQYIQNRQQVLELYKTVPPQLKPYYRAMVQQYFQMIGK